MVRFAVIDFFNKYRHKPSISRDRYHTFFNRFDLHPSTLDRYVKRLIKEGYVMRLDRGLYRVITKIPKDVFNAE